MVTEPGVLPAGLAAELSRAPYSYSEVGQTRAEVLPSGYRYIRRQVTLSGGRERFESLAEALMTWRLHAAAGLELQVSTGRAEADAVLVATLRLGPVPIRTRCRVVYVIAEPERIGFAYGTLPGHPERGEERFVVRRDGDRVSFELTAFAVNASPVARLGGPVSRAVQRRVNSRYLAAAQRL
jgi:uncharacterized protein (UPF0548 family)